MNSSAKDNSSLSSEIISPRFQFLLHRKSLLSVTRVAKIERIPRIPGYLDSINFLIANAGASPYILIRISFYLSFLVEVLVLVYFDPGTLQPFPGPSLKNFSKSRI